MSGEVVVILDCYTVEPSGLGVPPYLSTYARTAYAAVTAARPGAEVRYLTIDDVRWCLNGGAPFVEQPLSDPLTYSTTVHRDRALSSLADAAVVVVMAGDAVPSVHLHAQNGSVEEIGRDAAAPPATTIEAVLDALPRCLRPPRRTHTSHPSGHQHDDTDMWTTASGRGRRPTPGR